MAGSEPDLEESEPSLRRVAIADNLRKSSRTKVLTAAAVRVDLTYFLSFRDIFKDSFQTQFGAPFRIEIFMLRAMAQALKEYPTVNSWFVWVHDPNKKVEVPKGMEGLLEIPEILDLLTPKIPKLRLYKKINIGLAFADEKGLLVPVVKDADQKDNAALAKEIERLYQGAKAGKLSPRDYKGATIILNNPGALGGVDGFSVPSPEQSAILSIQKIEENSRLGRGWCKEAELDLVFDHQACDGREAMGFLNSIKSYFESEKYKSR
ncbi:MAG: 2-oxo acid dehydrogenase subunit E2 [Parcubacteria group bacterium]|nr:2-oxo acid dehydrogenase subunit E2 [Parcubacteria group bacterium]